MYLGLLMASYRVLELFTVAASCVSVMATAAHRVLLARAATEVMNAVIKLKFKTRTSKIRLNICVTATQQLRCHLAPHLRQQN
jgi:hypothetical protein